MPSLNGILETALYVRDLEAARTFYQDVFGFPELMREEGRLIGLRVANAPHVLLLFALGKSTEGSDTPGGHIPAHDGHGALHLCFAINPDDTDVWRAHLAARGVSLESQVAVPADAQRSGGTSLYFRDPDHHLIELAPASIWPNIMR